MLNSLLYIFNPANFEAHGVHFVDTPGLFWSLVIANLLTFIAYTLIPIALAYFIHKRKGLVFRWIFIFFGLFIVLCGIHHLLHVITFWYPIYGIEVANDILLAVVSISTFFGLLSVLPEAIKLRTPAELEKINNQLIQEIENREQVEEALKNKNKELETMNKSMVGRELKMLELKKEIESLKRK